ncbi:MAG: polysaccharide deacetylase family protein [Candidatus Levybacteria bacterium]|nr:polysaccharide deacetylase family protein [Candidatus Levybacteria bacterium]
MKTKKPQMLGLKQNFIAVLFLILFLSLLTSPFHFSSGNITTSSISSINPQKKVPTLIKKVQADIANEDYCITVPVILYHHVQPLYLSSEKQQDTLSVGVEYFDMHMNYLSSQGYVSLTADQLVHALLNREELPSKSIVVTFDDGYEDNYLYAYPILKKYNIKGNFMISTGLIGRKDYMSWDQLIEMSKNSLVKLYNHTVDHVDVGNATPEAIERQITSAQDTLAEETGSDSPIFTYPYGSSSTTTFSVLKKLGFAAAFSTKPGFTQCRSFILDLHRNHVGNLPLSSFGL